MPVRHRSRSGCEQSTGLIRPPNGRSALLHSLNSHFAPSARESLSARISSRLRCNRGCRKAACVLQSRTKPCSAWLAHRFSDVAQTLMVSHAYIRTRIVWLAGVCLKTFGIFNPILPWNNIEEKEGKKKHSHSSLISVIVVQCLDKKEEHKNDRTGAENSRQGS